MLNKFLFTKIEEEDIGLLDVKPGFEPQARNTIQKVFLRRFLSTNFWHRKSYKKKSVVRS